MERQNSLVPRFAFVFVVALLALSTAVFAQDYRGDRISVVGTVTGMQRMGPGQFSVNLDHGRYTYYVPAAEVHNRDIRIGDRVRIDGFVGDSNIVNAEMIAFAGEPAYTTDPYYRTVPYGSTGWLSGTITQDNRRLGYMRIRDDNTGQLVKIDTRSVPEHLTLRRGDHVSVNGAWEQRDLFQATRVAF